MGITELEQESRYYAEKYAQVGDVRPYKRYKRNLMLAFQAGANWQKGHGE